MQSQDEGYCIGITKSSKIYMSVLRQNDLGKFDAFVRAMLPVASLVLVVRLLMLELQS
jgi:hypothetical protein